MTPPPEIPPELRQAGEGERRVRAARDASRGRSSTTQRLMEVGAIGTEFAVAVVGGAVLGYGIDYLAGTAPWGLLAGCVVGLVWGFVRFVRTGLAMASGSPTRGKAGRRPPTPPDAPPGSK
ncbi:MAG: AtpZ/AtpI family protein [Phycisphaerales bacterium]